MAQKPPAQKTIEVPAPTIGVDFAQLLHNDENADITFRVVPEAAVEGSVDQADSSMIEGEQCVKAHRLVLQVCFAAPQPSCISHASRILLSTVTLF